MTIRVYGNLLYTTGAWGPGAPENADHVRSFTEQDVAEWMQMCTAAGATAVLWQSNNGGLSTHPSPVFALAGPPCREHNEAYTPVWRYLGEQLRTFDTLAAAVRQAHAHGLRLVYGYCPCDFVDSPFEDSPFHPDLWVLSRRGEPFHGVPCYAEPRVQEMVLRHLVDVLDHGVDDLVFSFFSHLQGDGTDRPVYYGYNKKIVQAFTERYGKDPRLLLQPPPELAAVYGDFFTGFLRRVRAETTRRGCRLIAGTSYHGHWGWGGRGGIELFNHCNRGAPAPSEAPACPVEYQFRRWADEALVDGLMVIAPPQHSVHTAREISRDTGLPVLLWHKTASNWTSVEWDLVLREAAAAKSGAIGGYVVHASSIVTQDEWTLRLWDLLRAGT